MTAKRFPLFDCDSHVFEPEEIWGCYVDPEYRVAARAAFSYRLGHGGGASVILNGRPARPMGRSRIVREAIWRPGLTPEDIGSLDPEVFHPINPGSRDPKARLKDMDELGVQGSLLFPTLFAEYFPSVANPDVAGALARAYNDWTYDFCRIAPDRLFPAAVLPVQDIELAVEEAGRVAARGFKAVFLRPAYFVGRFLNHSSYDPLWRALEGHGLCAFVHPSPGSANPEWTSAGSFVDRVAENLQIGHNVAESIAPTIDNCAALATFTYGGHMERYPRLRLAFAHSGVSWALLTIEKVEGRLISRNFQNVSLQPDKLFLARPSLLTFDAWESSVAALLDVYADVAAWGSRYPQHDTFPPQAAMELLESHGAPPDAVAKVMGGNALQFLGLDAPVVSR